MDRCIIGGALISLYQWRPMIFKKVGADDRFMDLALSWILALLSAIIIPKVPKKHLCTALRWFVPFIIIVWYDRWESNTRQKHLKHLLK
jgi:hypothetical protein